MSTIFRSALVALILTLPNLAGAQSTLTSEYPLMSVELFSPWERNGEKTVSYNRVLAARSCFSLVEYRWSCSKGLNISYGNRMGDNWDILALHGTQSRMIDLGLGQWADKMETPYVAPFKGLAPGEKRHITVNTSGGDGADGRPGVNADGSSAPYVSRPKRESYANKPVAEQVSSKTETRSGELFVDNYNPFLEARKGHMYAIRLFEGSIDQYYLMRVDDVVRGQKIVISIKRIEAPSKRPVF